MGWVCNKKQFRKKEAEALLKHKGKGGIQRRNEIRAYQCPSCNMWHLTSLEEGDTRKAEDFDLLFPEKWNEILKQTTV